MSRLSSSEIDAIKRDDPDDFEISVSQLSESEVERMWRLIDEHQAVNILYRNGCEAFSEKRYFARKNGDWETLKLFLDAVIANPRDRFIVRGDYNIEYQYMLTKGYDFSEDVLYVKEAVPARTLHLLLTLGMSIHQVDDTLYGYIHLATHEPEPEKKYPHEIYNLMMRIIPTLPGSSYDELHGIMVYDNVDCTKYDGTGMLHGSNYFPVFYRLLAYGHYEHPKVRDHLFLKAIGSNSLPEALDVLESNGFTPSEEMTARVRRFVK